MNRPNPASLAAVLLIGLAGCGAQTDEFPREAVSGTVTLDGQPLKEGTIQFMPDAQTSNGGTGATGMIRAGQFEIPRAEGPSPGHFSVVILSGGGSDGITAATIPGEGPIAKETIPARYNAQTTLSADIKPGGPNTLEFPLKTK